MRREDYERARDREELQRDCESWLLWMMREDRYREWLATQPESDLPCDVRFWSEVMARDPDDPINVEFRTFSLLPIERERIPIGEDTVLCRYQVIEMPFDAREVA